MVCMFLHLSYIPQCCGILILSGKFFDILLVIKCPSLEGSSRSVRIYPTANLFAAKWKQRWTVYIECKWL